MPFVGDITAQKLLFTKESWFLGIHLNPPSSPDSGRWARGAFLIHVNGVNITLTLAQQISDGLTFMALSQSRAGGSACLTPCIANGCRQSQRLSKPPRKK